ncbi:MAG: hypothetical protein ACD_26C00144G0002 [uncultured bacterium]|nr:MAG: hypothetical protein ACD_26C00144G0002 [uncultured bacterium]
MKKFILGLYLLVVVFVLFILIGGKIKSFGRIFLATQKENNVSYGDLYTISELKAFHLPIPTKKSTNKSNIDEADIFAFGDSFLGSHLGEKNLPSLLEDSLKMPVYAVPLAVENPLEYLERIHYKKGATKIVIVESVERYAVNRGFAYSAPIATTVNISSWKKNINDLDYLIFDTTDIDYFFKHNIFINPLRLFLKNLNFSLFGRIDSRIGAYSLQPPMLFYFEEVNFDKNLRNATLAPKVAKNIKFLGETLKDKYNLKMIYVVIPNKYTIYNDLDKHGSYNNFIPRLQSELSKLNVDYVDLYSRYVANRTNDRPLYYPNDSHFAPLGKEILVEELDKKIKQILKK